MPVRTDVEIVCLDQEYLNVFTLQFRSKLGFSLDDLDSGNRPNNSTAGSKSTLNVHSRAMILLI